MVRRLRPFFRRRDRTARPHTCFMRARNPCLLMRRRLRGRYVGPIHFLSRGGKRTLSRTRRSRLTFPHTTRSFGPPLLDVPPLVIRGWSSLLKKRGSDSSTRRGANSPTPRDAPGSSPQARAPSVTGGRRG